ncbi:hypothetical protein BTIS_0982 [Bifidobacterium tissieri]|uniref:Uncharacterized protein n=1 Tax=Bifidobacterium tissieri TaxID=1630162 RepID=A0A261FG72_9BIFI|nr:hypothetical protein [Bifidobacterium tissieri]OZG58134.1 hypothetical protein BTIS_0982 [Bifidobacterium tissieri]
MSPGLAITVGVAPSAMADETVSYAQVEERNAQERLRANCSYFQYDTQWGDHRFAINYTCDQGLQHWFSIGGHKYVGGRVTPVTTSDHECTMISGNGGYPVPRNGGSCAWVDEDLVPAITDWGNYFG